MADAPGGHPGGEHATAKHTMHLARAAQGSLEDDLLEQTLGGATLASSASGKRPVQVRLLLLQ